MFHVELAPLGGILDPLKSDLGVFWAKIPLSSDWFYNVKTQKTLFLQNSSWDKAEIENIHCPICTQPIPSSWQNGLPPAFATLEQRGEVQLVFSMETLEGVKRQTPRAAYNWPKQQCYITWLFSTMDLRKIWLCHSRNIIIYPAILSHFIELWTLNEKTSNSDIDS